MIYKSENYAYYKTYKILVYPKTFLSYQRSLALEERCAESMALLRDGWVIGEQALSRGLAVLEVTSHNTFLDKHHFLPLL